MRVIYQIAGQDPIERQVFADLPDVGDLLGLPVGRLAEKYGDAPIEDRELVAAALSAETVRINLALDSFGNRWCAARRATA